MQTVQHPHNQCSGASPMLRPAGRHACSWRWQRSIRRGPSSFVCATRRADVILTREKGKNGPLAKLLDQKNISWVELPLIESAAGPDRQRLAEVLQQESFDWIVITSPEAAAVFLEGWREAGKPQVRIAVVGGGSGRVIEAENASELLQLQFTPSKANAVHLAAELPLESGSSTKVLYPASSKAAAELQAGLERRGCAVQRLNTYDTVPVSGLEAAQLEAARAAAVIAVASPSAVEAWVNLGGGTGEADVAVACIGSTSARAAERLGLKRIFYPDAPGLPGFVNSIEDALKEGSKVGV